MRFVWFLLACLATSVQAEDRVEVDVELFLAVDVSRSMQPYELEIQRRGYAAALQSAEVQDAIASGFLGRIAITYVEWAGAFHQREIVPWTVLGTQEDAARIAGQITSHLDQGMRRTSISSALTYAADSIEANGFDGLRRVIDVSGDGPNNMGVPVTRARDEVLARGITINGLPLMTQDEGIMARWNIPDLDVYYTACVIGGTGAFVVPVTDWSEFEDAVRRKLVLEIAGQPATLWQAQVRSAAPYNCLIGEEIWERNRDIFALP
ncbi:DUF1194 domain-containing protein [Tateyamaria sp. ANG-S1]|uniref:DUF1194 domain-containing protein n=1 Tax=Tateyamaria sp. ANG-S1 TaxID=1577905 RepID=UPI00057F1CD2|nr:DUF1194 domain-containing protein [Tateyamaria sp. ANG-S1]KIC49210.1 hypothetical protein RA29_12445 [Tateyamaria sp. ANG-S1]